MIPDFVKQFCKDQLKDKNKVRVDVDNYVDPDYKLFKHKHGLDFGVDLCFYGLDGTVITLEDYILRLMKYARGYFKICIDGVPLSQIFPKALPPVETPPIISLENIGDDHGQTTAQP